MKIFRNKTVLGDINSCAVNRSMLMTACDLGAVTRPWKISKQVWVSCWYSHQFSLHLVAWRWNSLVKSVCFSVFMLKIPRIVLVLNFVYENHSHLADLMKLTPLQLPGVMRTWSSNNCMILISKVAELVTSEFFEQGDRERAELKLTPAVSKKVFRLLQAMQFTE